MAARTKVSVITTSFNSAGTIGRTLDSVLMQTYPEIEYIIVDGGSNDSTMEIVSSYASKFNGRLRWISESDEGMYDAMNKGIRMAEGEMIGILNSDDWYEPDAVEMMVQEHRKHPDAVLYGILRYVENGKETMLYRMHHDSLHEGMITHPTCFVPKTVYERHGVFNTHFRLSSDYELMLRFRQQNVQFRPLDRIIANFTFGGRSTVNHDGMVENLHIRRSFGYISGGRMRWELTKLYLKSLLKKFKVSV
jgi:glycosyltransferase involved in cell wall biosynthesis